MELLKLSKFKLQLRSLITEVRDLNERERAATEQLHLLIQKQKQTEEDYGRKSQELRAELASSNELRQKLERKVNYLQNDNSLLENKQKELKTTIESLLQSRENFLNAYEESTCEMKRSIKAKDRKIHILSEKMNSHFSLLDSIEKEAFVIKQVVDNVLAVVNEKEEVVAGLRGKMDHISAIEKIFFEKFREIENKLKKDVDKLQRKDKIISELEAQLEDAQTSNNCQTQIEELQKTLSAKDAIIQNLISEKEALRSEVGSYRIILQKIQDTVTNMNTEDKSVFTLILTHQGESDVVKANEDTRTSQNLEENSPKKASMMHNIDNRASPLPHENGSAGNPLQENDNFKCSARELAGSPTQVTCSEPQAAVHVFSISVNDGKE